MLYEGTNTVFSTGAGSSFSPDGGNTWTPIDNVVHLYVDLMMKTLDGQVPGHRFLELYQLGVEVGRLFFRH